ncbi:PREDICTED: olfactory receptor 6N1-like [Nanorana parkeri]|uniref:olfactory receptor 6N1-like n=1 Tax=Nanorana parkeri TaxID=125878 RepID=UPI0008547532|nr:PREDICTED: olfactory receptor 6N1-like [Nanorana parkeri]
MENISMIGTQFILVGLAELADVKYLSFLVLAIYIVVMALCSLIVFVTWTEETLHEPMYIFIANLMLADMYGSTAIMPKLIIDLMTGCVTISFTGCLAQGFFLQTFPGAEIFTFTAMAYDRYLAVGHPLRYPMLMNNKRAFNILVGIWIYVYVGICAIVVIASRQTLCGVRINSVFCETISLTHLSCGNNTLGIVFGFTWTMLMIVGCVCVVVYCYIRTFLVCLKISQEACEKAIHTLVTHIIAFFTFLASSLFTVFRYRIKGESLTFLSHLITSIAGLASFTLNPVIYGIRTEALRTKMSQRLKSMKSFIWTWTRKQTDQYLQRHKCGR